MPVSPPPFAVGRNWRAGVSDNKRHGGRVWKDRDNGFEYEPDPRRARGTWHEMNPRTGEYRDVDPDTGKPVAGREGQWRPLK